MKILPILPVHLISSLLLSVTWLSGLVRSINEHCTFDDISRVFKGGHMAGWAIPTHCSALSIFEQSFQDHDLKYLAKALSQRVYIRSLSFARNNLGDTGIQTLMDSIKNMNALNSLDVSENNISSSGMVKLFHELSSFENLEKINAEGNRITIQDMDKIVNDLISMRKIKLCNLRRTFLDNHGVGYGMYGHSAQVDAIIKRLEGLQQSKPELHILIDLPMEYNFETGKAVLESLDRSSKIKVDGAEKIKVKLFKTPKTTTPSPLKEKAKEDVVSELLPVVSPVMSSLPLHSSLMNIDEDTATTSQSSTSEIPNAEPELTVHTSEFFDAVGSAVEDCLFSAAERRVITSVLFDVGLSDIDSVMHMDLRELMTLTTSVNSQEGIVLGRMLRCVNVYKCFQNIVLGSTRGNSQFDLESATATCKRLYYDQLDMGHNEQWLLHEIRRQQHGASDEF